MRRLGDATSDAAQWASMYGGGTTTPGSGGLTPVQESAAASALADLDALLSQVRSSVESTTSTFGASNVKDAILKNLDADGARIERLRGPLLDEARAGGLGWARWINIAQATHDDIAYQGGLTSDWAMTGVLKSTVSATALAVSKMVNPFEWPWYLQAAVVGGLALYGLHLVKPWVKVISTRQARKKLSSYRRSTR